MVDKNAGLKSVLKRIISIAALCLLMSGLTGSLTAFSPVAAAASTGSNPTIAASDASQTAKDAALASGGAVCDGNDDQVQINAAINSLPLSGGLITLSSGTFNLSAPVTLNGRPETNRHEITLQGQGDSTVLRLAANANCNVIEFDASWPFNNQFEDFQINGNKAHNTSGWGIEFEGWQVVFDNLGIQGCASGGIHSMDTGPAEGNRYKNLWIYNCDNYGILADPDVTDEVLDDVYVSTTTVGVDLQGFNRISNLEIDGAKTGLRMTSFNVVSGASRIYAAQAVEVEGMLNTITGLFIQLDDTTRPGILIDPGPGAWGNKNRFADILVSNGSAAIEISGDKDKCGFSAYGITLNNTLTAYGPILASAMSANPSLYSVSQVG
jgi:hypothetical protein